MSTDSTTHEIIASALRLPIAERTQILNALEDSLMDASVDHGADEPASEVGSAWEDEISRRIEDVDSGRVPMIGSDEAWKMIDGEAPPQV